MSTQDSNSTSPESPQIPELHPIFKFVLFPFMFVIFAFRKGRQSLWKRSYDNYDGGGFLQFLGVVFGLLSGIGTGYYLGWMNDANLFWWLGSGATAATAVFIYIWPLLYVVLIRHFFSASEYLWEGISDHNWLSGVLTFLTGVAIVGSAAYLGWDVMISVKTNMVDSWASFLRFPVGIVAGLVVAFLTGGISFGLLNWMKQGFIAAATGIVGVHLASTYTESVVSSLGVPAQSVWVAYVLQFAIYVAYVFPLAHLVVSRLFSFLENIFDHLEALLENTYGDKETASNYRKKFFANVINIAGTAALTRASFSLWAYLGFDAALSYGSAVGLAAASYLLLGMLLKSCSNKLVGVVTGLHSAVFAYMAYTAAGLWFGNIGAAVAAVSAFLATVFLAFPIAYQVVRFVAELTRISLLGNLLHWVHEGILDTIERGFKEIAHAFDNTYDDESPYARMFAHLANLAVVAGVVYGGLTVLPTIGIAAWAAYTVTAVLVATAYLLAGKLLIRWGNPALGWIAAIAGGVASGTVAWAYMPGGSAWWIAAAAGTGIAGALVTGFALFPVAYVVVKLPAGPLLSGWLGPILGGIFDFFWSGFSAVWTQMVLTYKAIEAWWTPQWRAMSKWWDEQWQAMSRYFNQNQR